MNIWRKIVHAILEDSSAQILERDMGAVEVHRLLVERAQDIIAATNVPTVDHCFLCESCGAIQGEPVNFHCQVCDRSELVSLTPRLKGTVTSKPRVSRFKKVAR